MDINWLIQKLRHGDSYTVQDGDNDPYQVTRPPNLLMIKAAEVIMRQSNQLDQANKTINNLQRQVQEIYAAYQTLRDSTTTATPSRET